MKKTIIMFVITALLLAGCENEDTEGKIAETASETVSMSNETTAHVHTDSDVITKGNLVKEGNVYKITEENYINGVNEIYAYSEDYLGERIEFEGEYMAEMYDGEMYYQVYRTLKVHNHDGHNHSGDITKRVGFRIDYSGDKPSDKAFVRVVGFLDTYEYQDGENLIIDADVLEECEKPGIVELEQ